MSVVIDPTTGTVRRTRSFTQFYSSSAEELKALGHDYLKLAGMKAHLAAENAKRGVVCLVLTLLFGVVGIGEAVFAVVGLLMAKDPGVHEYAEVVGVSALVCLGLAVFMGLATKKFFTALSSEALTPRTAPHSPQPAPAPVH